MGVKAPADKRFRRAHVRPARKRSRLPSWKWRAVAAAVVLGATLYAGRRAIAVVAGLDVFQVERITVGGNHRLSKGEVLALLEGLHGRSILRIDLEEWRTALRNSPWVADASLRRTLPSTVDVAILERSPLGIGRINGVLYLVDDLGVAIDEYGPIYADLDLPIIDGLSSVAGDEYADVHRAALARRLIEAMRVGNMAGRISEIDVRDSRNAVVLLDGDPTLIRLGHERFAERLQSYLELAPALRERVPSIDYVDLRFDERLYVRPARDAARYPGGRKTAPKGRPERGLGVGG